MTQLHPQKLHVDFGEGATSVGPVIPRAYTLTHSDRTGDLYLTIAEEYNLPQISGWYTRLMRDEVLAKWDNAHGSLDLHVHCHVSGGLLFGSSKWRESVFRHHMPMVLEAFRHGDRGLYEAYPELDQANVWVHFHWAQPGRSRVEPWGQLRDFRIEASQTGG